MTYAAESVADIRLIVVREFRKSSSALERLNIVGNNRDDFAKVVCYFLDRLD